MSENQKGITFVEILVSLTIASIMLIMLFQTIDYTVTARSHLEIIKKGTEYSETFTKLFINKLKEKEILPHENVITYLSETPDQRKMLEELYELEDYEYSFLMLEEASLKEGLQTKDLIKGMYFSTAENFDFKIFQDLIESEAFMINIPKQKEIQARTYEGLALNVTEEGKLAIRGNVVTESDRACIEMEMANGPEGWRLDIHPQSLNLDGSKAIHIVLHTAYYDEGNQINVVLNNHTICPVIVEVRGKSAQANQVEIINGRDDVPLLVYESQLDYPTEGYVLIALVTTKNYLGKNKVIKQSLVYL